MQVIEEHTERARSDDEGDLPSQEYRLQRLDVHSELVEAIASGDQAVVGRALARHRGQTRAAPGDGGHARP